MRKNLCALWNSIAKVGRKIVCLFVSTGWPHFEVLEVLEVYFQVISPQCKGCKAVSSAEGSHYCYDWGEDGRKVC